MKVKTLVVLVGVLAAVAVAVALLSRPAETETTDETAGAEKTSQRGKIKRRTYKDVSAKESIRQAMSGCRKTDRRTSQTDGRRRIRKPADMFANLKGEDRRLAEAVQEALDENDFEAVVVSAEKAAASRNPEVRMHAVNALGWFGAEALPELTVFMSDKDEEVANEAADQWQLGLNEIEEDDIRIATAEAAMRTLNHEEAMQQIVGEITGQSDEFKIVQALADIIDSGNRVGMKIAQEEYEALTGEEWTGLEAAQAWLDENYEPEEPDEEQNQEEQNQEEEQVI